MGSDSGPQSLGIEQQYCLKNVSYLQVKSFVLVLYVVYFLNTPLKQTKLVQYGRFLRLQSDK